MAGSKGDVELVIRAKNEATKSLDAINKSLKALSDQQTIVGDSATETGSQLGRLGQQLTQLRTNANNLKSLTSVATVLNGATQALARQRATAADTAEALTSLTERQKQLESSTRAAGDAAKQSTDAVKTQDAAYKGIKASLNQVNQEQTALATTERNSQRSLDATVKGLVEKNAKLQESIDKEAKARAAIESSQKVTRAQQTALESATKQLERRQKAVDDATAKEAALRATLEATRATMAANKAAVDTATAALKAQAKAVSDAREASTLANQQAKEVASSQRTIAAEVTKATAAQETQVANLREAEAEYTKLQGVVNAARTALGQTAPVMNEVGAAAGRAAIQAVTLAARLSALSGAGTGKKTAALGIDPAAIREANGSVRELGVTIRLASNDATKTTVSLEDLTAAVKGVGAARASLTGIGDALTTQSAAVSAAKQEFLAARAEVRRLGDALKNTSEPSEQLAAALGRAQAAASLALRSFKEQSVSATTLLGSLQQAGIGAGTFASAEAALAPELARVNQLLSQGQSALAALPENLRRAGQSAGEAEPKVSRLSAAMAALLGGISGLARRTNPLGGLAGQLTGAVTAAAGLYGIKDQLDKILQAGLDLDANKARFTAAFGSIAAGTKELDYARKVAENLRLPINDLASGYSKLALAAKGTALEGAGVRGVFEAFAQSTRVNQSSTADLNGVFTALTQIISKGRVQLEELSGQLGDRLPGALQLMAEGLGVSTKDLLKMVSAGNLTSSTLLNLASSVSSRVGPALKAALESPAAQIQNFENQITKLRETIAGSGFLNAFADGLTKVSTALSTPEAIQGAKDLGAALADMVGYLAQAPEHFTEIVDAIKALGIAWVGLQITSIVTGLYGFATAIGATTVAVLGLDVALSPVLVGLAALAAAVATVVGAFGLWKLAEWCYENFPVFAEGVQNVKLAALDAWDGIVTAWDIAAVQLKASFGGAMDRIKDMWYGTINDILKFAPNLTEKLGLGDLAGEIEKQAADASANAKAREDNLQNEIDSIRQKGLVRQQENAKKTEDAIYNYHLKRITDAQTDDERANSKKVAEQLANGLKPQANTPQFPGAPVLSDDEVGLSRISAPKFVPDTSDADAKKAAAAAKKRVALEKSVNDEILGIRAQLEKKSADDLDEQIAAVPAKYAVLIGKLRALGRDHAGDEGYDAIQALIKQEQQLLRIADTKKKQAADDKLTRELEAAENAKQLGIQQGINALVEERKDIQLQMSQALDAGDGETYDKLREQLKGVNVELMSSLDAARSYWEAFGGPEADLAIAKIDKMKTSLIQVKDGAILTGFTIGKSLGTSLKGAGDGFVDKLVETGNVFKSLKDTFLDFAQTFFTNIAKMILQQLLFNAIKAGLSAFGGGGAIGAGVLQGIGGGTVAQQHNGGVVGSANQSKTNVDMSMFRNAVRHHEGGEAGATGLRANEVATVLEKGETVRTQAQEAALAANQQAGVAGQAPMNLKVVNAIDSLSILEDALSSPKGEKVIMNVLKANQRNVRVIAGTQ